MWLFFLLVFLVVFLACLFDTKRAKGSRAYICFTFLIFAILMMFRSINVGNDTDVYTHLFNSVSHTQDINAFILNSRFEAGYIYLNKFLSMVSDNAQILFTVTGAFTAFSFGRFLYKYSKLPWMSVLMFLTLQFFDLSLTGVRQIVSIAILLFSYDYLVNRKLIKFVLIVLLASMIHGSAILFLVMYPLTISIKERKFYLISGSAALGVFLGFQRVIPLIARVFPQYVKYLTTGGLSYSTEPTLAVFLMLALWTIMFAIAKSAIKSSRGLNSGVSSPNSSASLITDSSDLIKTCSIHEVAVWLGVLMLFLALQGTILNRFKYIFSVPMLVYYPNALSKVKYKNNKALLIACSCAIFVLYSIIIYVFRPEWQSTYPYSFFWD